MKEVIACPYECGWTVEGGHLGLSNHILHCPLRTTPCNSSSRTPLRKRTSILSRRYGTERTKRAIDIDQADEEIEIEKEDCLSNVVDRSSTNKKEDGYAQDGIIKNAPGDSQGNNVRGFAVKLNRLIRKAERRDVADVYRMIISGEVSIEQLRKEMPTIDDVKHSVHSLVEERLQSNGFVKRIVSDEAGIVTVAYVRKLKTVLQKQIEMVRRSEIFVNGKEARRGIGEDEVEAEIHSHPMAAGIGKHCVNIVREYVESVEFGLASFWKSESNRQPSFAGILQIYTDESVTSMKASGFVFYPLHALLMNYDLSSRRKLITGGHTIVGYLPCEYSSASNGGDSSSVFGVNRDEKLRILHNAVQMMTDNVKTYLTEGFPVKTSDGKEMTLHPCIGSYVADLPEAKDLLGVLNGNRGVRNCHRCFTYSSDMNKYNNNWKSRRLKEMSHALSLFRELVRRTVDTDALSAEECKRVKEKRRKYSESTVLMG